MKSKVVEIQSQTVEEFGQLDAKVKAFAPTKDRHEALRKKIQAWYDKDAANKAFHPESAHYVATVGERSMERTLTDMKGLAKHLGRQFWKLCTMRLGDVDAHVTEPDRAQFVNTKQTGSRKVTVAPKPEAVAVEMRKAA